MAGISTFASYKSKVADPWQVINPKKLAFGATSNLYSAWLLASEVGVAPTTAVVPTSATLGSLAQPPLFDSAGVSRLARFQVSTPSATTWMLCDRLSHQGGLSGTATGAQTTNLPTAALTRGTGGDGVLLGLEVYTQIGASLTTVTASYTNQAGTAAQTTEAVSFGGTNYREANRIMVLPLQTGDTGVRAVASVTAAATTGTAGNYGVTLFRPLYMFSTVAYNAGLNLISDGFLSKYVLPVIPAAACLFWVAACSVAGTVDTSFAVKIIEE